MTRWLTTDSHTGRRICRLFYTTEQELVSDPAFVNYFAAKPLIMPLAAMLHESLLLSMGGENHFNNTHATFNTSATTSTHVAAKLAAKWWYTLNPQADLLRVQDEFHEEMCLLMGARMAGYLTTYRMQTRENDKRSCKVGLWSWACTTTISTHNNLDGNMDVMVPKLDSPIIPIQGELGI